MEDKEVTLVLFDDLLNLEKIEPEDIEDLNPEEKRAFLKLLHNKMDDLEGAEREAFLAKTRAFFGNLATWEQNHARIRDFIEYYIGGLGKIPTKQRIADELGLSRKTVHEHLSEVTEGMPREDARNALSFMPEKVTATVLQAALKGDLKAAKLFIDITRRYKAEAPDEPNENDYIKLNDITVRQNIIDRVSPDIQDRILNLIMRPSSRVRVSPGNPEEIKDNINND